MTLMQSHGSVIQEVPFFFSHSYNSSMIYSLHLLLICCFLMTLWAGRLGNDSCVWGWGRKMHYYELKEIPLNLAWFHEEAFVLKPGTFNIWQMKNGRLYLHSLHHWQFLPGISVTSGSVWIQLIATTIDCFLCHATSLTLATELFTRYYCVPISDLF